MERRSTRGRVSEAAAGSKAATAAAAPPSPMAPPPPPPPVVAAVVEIPASDVPEQGGEEVVLNRRGMPARARKKNRFIFDDDVMVTENTKKVQPIKTPKRVKTEPTETEYDDDEDDEMPDLTVASEEEVPSAVAEEIVCSPSPRKPGRPPKKVVDAPPSIPVASKQRRDREMENMSSPKGGARSAESSRYQAARSPLRSPEPKQRGRPEIRKPNDRERERGTPQKTHRREEVTPPPRTTKSPEKARTSNKDDRVRPAEFAPAKPLTKVKREPGVSLVTQAMEQAILEHQQRYALEKKERDRIAKEKEKEKKKQAERMLKEREREYNSVLPLKSRGRREPSPPNDFASQLLSGAAMEDYRQTIDKKTAQDISLRLRNLLKLPKAHKWVCYEWFYSNIDKVLFEGENDFQTCLRESFPLLKARKLTRVEWCKIRRIMGKPRRCSQAFFDEEREELGRRRQKIRMIQQRKITDFNYKELPDEIPLQLTIGTKVTARLRRPQDGLFTGTIEGVDTSNNTYRITFDRAGLGTHSIPDYEVLSNDPVETVSTSSFALKIPRRSFGLTAAFKFQNPGLIGEDGLYRFPTSPFPEGGMLGGFPIRLLDMIVRLSKLLKAKREKILQLKELNVEAEKMLSYGKQYNTDFRVRYARCVLDLDSMNKEMAMYVEGIQTYCLEQIAPDHGANQMIVPEQVQDQCKQEASLIVDTSNSRNNRRCVHDQKSIALISNLTSLMLQIKTLSNGERNLYELKSIKDTIKETKATLEGKNLQLFQNRVEIPMNRIQAGLCIYTKSF